MSRKNNYYGNVISPQSNVYKQNLKLVDFNLSFQQIVKNKIPQEWVGVQSANQKVSLCGKSVF